MQSKEKLALFDFCETIVNFQTANAFIEFVCNSFRHTLRYYLYYCYKFLNKTYIISLLYRVVKGTGGGKRVSALFLKGILKEEFDILSERFYKERISINIIPEVIEELKLRQNEGYRIVIISGGYEDYIKYFAKDYGINDIIANKIDFSCGVCSGTFGIDCMNTNKVKLLQLKFPYKEQLLDSYFYTDSITDLPLLEIVDNRVVVSHKYHQQWANEQNKIKKEIIW